MAPCGSRGGYGLGRLRSLAGRIDGTGGTVVERSQSDRARGRGTAGSRRVCGGKGTGRARGPRHCPADRGTGARTGLVRRRAARAVRGHRPGSEDRTVPTGVRRATRGPTPDARRSSCLPTRHGPACSPCTATGRSAGAGPGPGRGRVAPRRCRRLAALQTGWQFDPDELAEGRTALDADPAAVLTCFAEAGRWLSDRCCSGGLPR